MMKTRTLAFAVLAITASAAPGLAAQVEIPRSPGLPYAAKSLPDRIVLTPGADPSREMAVAFRTDTAQTTAEAEIAPAIDGPSLAARAVRVVGAASPIENENGKALYHQVRFTGLEPGRGYVYRVKGSAGWSEWLQFRTAHAEARPFRFLYFGDTQNNILSIASRVIRQAFHATAAPALVVHAGDLVAQRDDLAHDDEWGEWTQAGGYNYSIVPQLPATGNHEYADTLLPDGSEGRVLGPHWPRQFALPANGADAAKATTYFVDYQGVRFIILDGTAALDLGALEGQTRWLDSTLAASPARWNVVLFHQPIFTCARPNDTAVLKAAWKPVFEARKVDLVLQGHDHCYSRLTAEGGKTASAKARADGKVQGPVYLVSVTGSKMYGLNDRAGTQPDRVAEDTELFQVVDVAEDKLQFRTFTATGGLYDGFDLIRHADGNRLVEITEAAGPVRRCAGQAGPDGLPCTADPKD
ncbi:purple acid phosphatase family protein [Sphingosinicella soli]|uniref:3',5'-cyclic AMP phosphodiesterase CpdA n=1 Tax=Sphingosinicella soli TaxID=333708 RepID=A0A7W7F502_9SPHN|nr:metallophosphoesterase family protein [Sphingosinicella soli]MBB4630801.1 3',5'-cyclic AMP phosphodiesterase CpdA [Sphingosinicella soli]